MTDTQALKKLVEGPWRPIEEAPSVKDDVLVKFSFHYHGDIMPTIITMYGDLTEKGFETDEGTYSLDSITHYQPLDLAEKQAEIIGVLVEALRAVECGSNAGPKTARATDRALAKQALTKAEALAKKAGGVMVQTTITPDVFMDGNMWGCLWGDDLQSGIAEFGKTALEAILKFEEKHPKYWVATHIKEEHGL